MLEIPLQQRKTTTTFRSVVNLFDLQVEAQQQRTGGLRTKLSTSAMEHVQ